MVQTNFGIVAIFDPETSMSKKAFILVVHLEESNDTQILEDHLYLIASRGNTSNMVFDQRLASAVFSLFGRNMLGFGEHVVCRPNCRLDDLANSRPWSNIRL